MDIKTIKTKSNEFFQKYKYTALIVLVGIVLLMIPGKSEQGQETGNNTPAPQVQNTTKEEL